VINSENDMRKLVRDAIGSVYWIEPASGSTPGLPDAFVVGSFRCVFLELKLLKNVGGRWLTSFTKEQRKTLPQLVRDGADIMLVLGFKGTDDVGVGRFPSSISEKDEQKDWANIVARMGALEDFCEWAQENAVR